jgi:arabinosaccharide transport system substrate-binding protein
MSGKAFKLTLIVSTSLVFFVSSILPLLAGPRVNIEFWGFATNRNKWYEAMAEDFKKKNPNVEIKVVSIPYAEMHDKVLTTLVAGTGAPDIADIEISRFGQYVKGRRIGFLALDDRLKGEMDNLFHRSALAPWSWQGKAYGLGNELNAVLLFYRWDMFDRAGIAAPINTWEDLTSAGKKLVAATGKKMIAPADNHWGYWWMIAAAGGGFFDEKGNVAADNEFGVRVLKMLRDWVYVDQIGMLAPGGNYFNQTYYGAMQQGEFAVQLGAPWYQGFMKDNAPTVSGKWRMQLLPTFRDGSGAKSGTFGGTGTSIPEQSRNKEVAWEFIKFANLTVDGVIKAFDMVNLYPTYKPAFNDPRLFRTDDYFSGQKPGEFIRDGAPHMPPLNNSPFWPEVTDAFNRLVLTPVMQNKKTPEEAYKDFRAEVTRVMR